MHIWIGKLAGLFAAIATGALTTHAAAAAQSQDTRKLSVSPIIAELMSPLETKRPLTGSSFRATTTVRWQSAKCILLPGAEIAGHIVEGKSHSKKAPGASLALMIDHANCEGHPETAVNFQLVAVVNRNADDSQDEGDTALGLYGGVGGKAPAASVSMNRTLGDLRVQSIHSDAAHAEADLPASVIVGQVIGIGGVTMSVGSGPAGSTVLRAASRNFRIERAATLVLMPPDTAPSKASIVPVPIASAAATMIVPPVPAAPAPEDETAVCKSNCSVESSLTVDTKQAQRGADELSLAAFGYRARKHPLSATFDDDATLMYMGTDRLLVTFDPHRLRHRTAESWHAGNRRTVRAVLLDKATRKVLRVVSWLVDGEGRYLWQAGPDRVLVSMHDALQIFDSNLNSQGAVSLGGDLLWAAASPQGTRIAFGVLEEQHSRELHETLRTIARIEPNELVRISLIDNSGTLLLSRTAHSVEQPPELSDDGVLLVRAGSPAQWAIELQTPNGAQRAIATVHSQCPPKATATADGAVFVVGCAENRRWYRLLRKDGKPVAKGEPSQQLAEQVAIGHGGMYAVRVVQLSQHADSARRTTSEIQKEQIVVYRASDGRRMLVAEPLSFPQSIRNFALSNDGSEMAALTATGIVFFPVPPPL